MFMWTSTFSSGMFLGEHNEGGPRSWEEEMEKIFDCVRERQLTEEMRDLVFGPKTSALVEGAADVDVEEPKRKARSKAQTTAATAQHLLRQCVGRSVAVATNEEL
jgi:hypothetical protein